MGGLGRWAADHAGTVVGVALLLALATASSVARCCAIHPSEVEEQRSPDAVADDELPEGTRALRKSYTDVTKEALALLAANVWADGQGTSVVTFTDRAMCTTSQGGESWEAYAVVASSRRTVAQGQSNATVTTLCVATAEWADIATLTVPSAGGDGAYATFSCPSICGGGELTLSPALKEVTIDGPDDGALEARGTSRESVEAALAQWCALWRPTATAATWTKVIEEDYGNRAYRIFYELDDRRNSDVTLVVGMDDGSLSVEEGGR